jgi:hypothetical protein
VLNFLYPNKRNQPFFLFTIAWHTKALKPVSRKEGGREMGSIKGIDYIMKPHIRLNIIVHEEENEYVAHCLEMDIVATNSTSRKAVNDLIDLIKAQITFAIENNNEDYLLRSAPFNVWEKIRTARKCDSRIIRIEAFKGKTSRKINPIREVELCIA